MGYLIELDLLRSLIIFPQPDESSPFHPNAPGKPDSDAPETADPALPAKGLEQREFYLCATDTGLQPPHV